MAFYSILVVVLNLAKKSFNLIRSVIKSIQYLLGLFSSFFLFQLFLKVYELVASCQLRDYGDNFHILISFRSFSISLYSTCLISPPSHSNDETWLTLNLIEFWVLPAKWVLTYGFASVGKIATRYWKTYQRGRNQKCYSLEIIAWNCTWLILDFWRWKFYWK